MKSMTAGLFAVAAVCTGAAAADQAPPWVDVGKVIDASRAAVAGSWKATDSELTVAAARSARLTLPVRPTGEYDYRVTFTRNTGVHSIALFFVAGRGQATFEVDAWGAHLAGIQNVGGKSIRDNSTRAEGVALKNGRKYTALIEVRRGEVRASLDGKLVSRYRGDGGDLSVLGLWRLPDAKALGVGAYESATTFHKIEVRAVSGSASVAASNRPTRPAATSPGSTRPMTTRPSTPRPTTPSSSAAPGGKRVLLVIANYHFFYREYADPRAELERAGIKVDVAAATRREARPHRGSGEGSDGGVVRPDVALADVDPSRYDAIVFAGGWGASTYQYAFTGQYADRGYNGDRQTRAAANRLINEFVRRDKYVGGICHGVSVLAWSRVNGKSLLARKNVTAPTRQAPVGTYDGRRAQPPSRWNAEVNGAKVARAGSVGNPRTSADDVVVDGKIITAENDQSARHFGRVLAERLRGGK